MAITPFSGDVQVIHKLGDRPIVDNNLTVQQFKDKFDEASLAIKTFLNNSLIPEIDSSDGVFEVTAPTTTYAEITTARSNNKIPYLFYNGELYIFSEVGGAPDFDYYFVHMPPNRASIYYCKVTSANQWEMGTSYALYKKPSGGIPKTDLASAVQASLGNADSAYQKPGTGIPKTDLASAVQTSLGLADTALQTAPEEVFWATYGTTTYADILQAVYEKKIVCCSYQNRKYYLTRTNPSPAYFTFVAHDANGSRYTLDLLQSGNTWSNANEGAPHSIPSGGSSGQVLKKSSGTDYDVEWANESGGGGSVSPYTSNPAALGTASPGSSDNYARGDHVHPKPTASDLGITVPEAATATPKDLGTKAVGTSTKYAREDHVHKLPFIPAAGSSNPEPLGTASPGVSLYYSAADHVHAMPTAADVGAIAAPSSPNVGDFLVYTATGWAAQSLSVWQGGSY